MAISLTLPFTISASKEPSIRVGLGSIAKEFTIGGTDQFSVIEASSGKVACTLQKETKCLVQDGEKAVYSVFIDTFYTSTDAENFAKTLLSRFPAGTGYNIVSQKGVFSLEIGEYQTEDEAKNAIKSFLPDLPKAAVVAHAGLTVKIGDNIVIHPIVTGKATKIFTIEIKQGQYAKYNGRRYRGILELFYSNEKFVMVNTLPFEDYLRGVVPAEMPALWHIEAVKSQAVAARTYAIRYIDRPTNYAYDICADTGCQVYGGLDREQPQSNRAIDETKGMVAIYQGKPIDAVFFANSGGYTENSEYVFSSPTPYLKGVPSPGEEESPRHTWFKTVPMEEFQELFKPLVKTDIGEIIDWKPTKLGVSGRTYAGSAIGTKGEAKVSGGTVRSAFSLNSTWFDVVFASGFVVFCGRGWGHGVGLSQYGAKAMAQSGKTYSQIISHYYQGALLTKWY